MMDSNEQPLLFKISPGLLFILVLFMCFMAGCEKPGKKKTFKGPPGYDLEHPIEIKLPLELDEISGVVYYPNDTSIMAINDEHGWLYKIYLNRPTNIEKWKFSGGADFEDLVLLDSTFYVLQSNGNLIVFRFISSDSLYLKEEKFPFGSGNEFEILYYDSLDKKLVMICKDCESDKKKMLSTYVYDPALNQYAENAYTVDVNRIAALAHKDKMKFKPSAAAINPMTGDLFIISAVNELLVIADRAGKAKEVYPIDHRLYKQPEGLSFTRKGTLIISNEAADIGVANIFIIPYKLKQAKE